MMEYVEVLRIPDIPDGTMKKVAVGNRKILIAHASGQIFATDLLCPHLEADLSEGTLSGTILTCPLHNSQFDLRDGRVVRWTGLAGVVLSYDRKIHPPRPLKCYPVQLEGHRILVAIP